jgi:hypothetical protein
VTHSAVADDAPDRRSRRALIGAGAIGAALALTGTRPAAASGTPGLSESDLELVGFAIGLELAARDLYKAAIAAGATGSIWQVLVDQHASYAELLAGISGISANQRNDDVYDSLVGGFETGTAQAGHDLENTAAATHFELLGTVVDLNAVSGIASIAAMESRHATVLAELAGLGDDLDALFLNDATPLTPEA